MKAYCNQFPAIYLINSYLPSSVPLQLGNPQLRDFLKSRHCLCCQHTPVISSKTQLMLLFNNGLKKIDRSFTAPAAFKRELLNQSSMKVKQIYLY